ncbi:hypothetical protein V2G26_006593 [Clonostachys chloroleuca]
MPPTPFPDLRQAPAPPVTSLFHASSMKLAGERILAAARATTEAIVHGDGPNKESMPSRKPCISSRTRYTTSTPPLIPGPGTAPGSDQNRMHDTLYRIKSASRTALSPCFQFSSPIARTALVTQSAIPVPDVSNQARRHTQPTARSSSATSHSPAATQTPPYNLAPPALPPNPPGRRSPRTIIHSQRRPAVPLHGLPGQDAPYHNINQDKVNLKHALEDLARQPPNGNTNGHADGDSQNSNKRLRRDDTDQSSPTKATVTITTRRNSLKDVEGSSAKDAKARKTS